MSTKNRIFEAAVELFSQKGFQGTSMRELAKAVGIKESSLYNHFSGKKVILDEILNYQMTAFYKSSASLDDLKMAGQEISDPIEFWMAGVMAFVKSQSPLTEPISRIIINEMFLNERCRDFVLNSLYTAQRELTEMVFRAMYEKGMIGKCDFSMVAAQYVYMIQGLEIENKLKMLEGRSEVESLEYMIEHMTFFINQLRRWK